MANPPKKFPSPKPEIHALSFDADGCIFHESYINGTEKDVIASNLVFLTNIKKENRHYKKTYTLTGSNRQSWAIDLTNREQKGSCFPAIKKISEHLSAEFDTLLLADIYGNLPAGSSYELIMKELSETDEKDDAAAFYNPTMAYFAARARQKPGETYQKHAEWAFDETKATILYAQMHKIAHRHMTENIVFDFYDDKGNGHRGKNPDILEHLRTFFSKYPELIPINVTLRLYHYAGDAASLFATIKGQGPIDTNYSQTVRDMAEIAKPHAKHNGVLFTAFHVEPGSLKSRHEIPAIKIEYGVKFNEHLKKIQNKATALRTRGHIIAATTADTLYNDLTQHLNDYHVNNTDSKEFQSRCNNAINNSRPILEKHRGFKEILGNIALFIASAGIGYIIGITYNKLAYGHFLPTFFKTNSAHHLDTMKNVVDEMKNQHGL